MKRILTFSGIFAVVLFVLSITVNAQVNAPQVLRVTVTDAQGQLVAGASCILTQDKKTIRETTTDANGKTDFGEISSGIYELKITAQGFENFEKTNIKIVSGEPLEITAVLKIADLTAQVTVENTTENVNSVLAGSSPPASSLQQKTIERLPLATKKIDEAIPLTPGVIRSSTGEISINGAGEQQSAFRVNGVNVADPASGNFRLSLPVDAVESVQVFRHPYAAEFGQFTGGLTNIETKRGGDRWHFEINDFLPDFRIVNGKITGVQDDTPHVNFNGPLVKDKLFVSQSLGYSISKDPVRGLVFPNNETISESQSYFTQLDWILSPKHSANFTFGYFPERDSFVNLDFFRPRSVTPNYKQKDFNWAFRDNYTFAGGLFESSVSYKKFDAAVWGQGTADQNITPTGESGNFFAMQTRRASRFEFFETYEFPAYKILFGTHNLKAGFDYMNVSNKMNYAARPVNVFRRNGTLASRTTFESAPEFFITNRTLTGFAQDRLIIRQNLSFDLGVRVEDQQIAAERNLAPRGGFAWSPFAGDKTVFRGGIGYFFDKVPLNIRAFARYPVRTVTRFAADGETVTGQTRFENVLVNGTEPTPLDFRRAKSGTGFVPESLTGNLQLDQIVNSHLSLRVNFTHSRTDRLYLVSPQTDFFGRRAIVLTPSGRTIYNALELTAKLTLPENHPFYLSYVRSKARGDLNDFNTYYGDFGFPVIRQNQYSNLSTDVPHRFLAWGSIALPRKINVSPILEWRNGFPYSVVNDAQIFVGTRNADNQRFPNFFSLDAEISRDFQVTKKYGIQLSLKVFNLTNHFNPRNIRNNTGDPQFGTFLNNYHRYFTGGFDIIF